MNGITPKNSKATAKPTVFALPWLILVLAALTVAACSTTPPEEVEAPSPAPTASPQPTRPQVAGEPGELLWRHEIGGAVASAPTVAGGVVYFGSEDHHVYALDAETGRVLWRFLAEREVWHSPTVHDGVVYVTSTRGYYGDGNSPVYALDAATGELRWRLPRERLRGVIPDCG